MSPDPYNRGLCANLISLIMAYLMPSRLLAAVDQRKPLLITVSGLFALNAHAAITAVDDTNPGSGDAFWAAGGDPVDSYTFVTIGDSVVSGGGVTGSLTVNGGSSLTTGVASIGEGAGTYGSALVSGAGSSWTVLKDPNDANDDGEIVVGSNGQGLLTIEDFASVTANNIYISDSTTADGTVLVDSSATLAVNQTLEVGYENTGALTVQDSAQVDAYSVLVGVESTGNGTLTVTDDGTLNVGTEQAGETYSGASSFNIGQSGTGVMNITDGGVVNSKDANIGLNAGSNGTVTVGGAGAAASWNVDGNLTVGNVGTGSLTINSNGTVDVTGFTELSDDGGSGSLIFVGGVLNTGTLAADPADLSGTGVINASGLEGVLDAVTFNAANTYTDSLNAITVNLTADGAGDLFDTDLDVNGSGAGGPVVVAFGGLGLGDEFGSSNTATVTGPNITLAITETTEVGYEGTATLLVEGGGAMTSGTMLIGEKSTGSGEVTVTGAGSTLDVSTAIIVGNEGDGLLDVLAGGSVSADSITISNQATSAGDLLVDGGSLDVANDLIVGNGAFGELAIENGGVVTVGGNTEVKNGVIFFDDAGNGVLNTGHLEVTSIDDIEGNGTINTSGITGVIAQATFDGDNANPLLYTENIDTTYIDEDTSLPVPSTVELNLTADGKGDLIGVDLVVRDGADIQFNDVDLGVSGGDTDTLQISGANSSLEVDELIIGAAGTGHVSVSSSGVVGLDANHIVLGEQAGGHGTLSVSGGVVDAVSLRVGDDGTGTVSVINGGELRLYTASRLGQFGGGSGNLIVDGLGSRLYTVATDLDVRNGTLTVRNGGVLDQFGVGSYLRIRQDGALVLDNGTVNALSLISYNPSNFSGVGTINTKGVEGLLNEITYDGTDTFSTTLAGGGITLNVTADSIGDFLLTRMNVINGADISANRVDVSELTIDGAGSQLDGGIVITEQLSVRGGAMLDAQSLFVSSGTATVEGSGSSVTLASQGLLIGDTGGSAEFFIEDGATVTAGNVQINYNSSGLGEVEVEVNGAGSSLTATNNILVGANGGTADLSIKGGATVSAGDDIVIGTDAVVNVVVYGNNQLNSGTDGIGGIQNDGQVNLFAYANLAAGVYTPVSTGSGTSVDLTGSGDYNAFGGVWNHAAMTFTVSAIQDASAGLTNADLSGLRASFDGGDLVVSFADGADADANFSVVEITDVSSIGGFSTVQAYGFTTDMVFGAEEQVLLSFNVGEGYNSDLFEFWHRADGATEWTLLDPDLANYEDGWVNFTVDGFSDYALTVPEPQAYGLIFGVFALLSVMTRRRV